MPRWACSSPFAVVRDQAVEREAKTEVKHVRWRVLSSDADWNDEREWVKRWNVDARDEVWSELRRNVVAEDDWNRDSTKGSSWSKSDSDLWVECNRETVCLEDALETNGDAEREWIERRRGHVQVRCATEVAANDGVVAAEVEAAERDAAWIRNPDAYSERKFKIVCETVAHCWHDRELLEDNAG